MKLLFDQNISHRLISLIQDILPEAKQVSQIGLEKSAPFAKPQTVMHH